MWTEKYRPASLDDMVGNSEGRDKFQRWLKKWKPGAKAALLVGPPGTGKTTTVHLVAEESGYHLVELNASDTRTKDKLGRRMGEAIASKSLFGGDTMIFLDEVDGLSGRSDFGAVEFIKAAVKESSSPVVMAANDPDADEVRKLGSSVMKIEFRRPAPQELVGRLERIAKDEKVKRTPEEIQEVAATANGDIRAAINFLQSGLPSRKDEDTTAGAAIDAFFLATDTKSALSALRSYPKYPREKVRELFTAVSRSKVHEERKAGALEVLSRADVLLGRMMKGKDWRLLRYLDPMLATDLWTALGDGGPRYTLDSVPWPLQVRIWNDSKKLKAIASLAGRRLGISQKGFLVEDMPYFLALCSQKEFRDEVVKSLDLEENVAAFLAKESGRFAARA